MPKKQSFQGFQRYNLIIKDSILIVGLIFIQVVLLIFVEK